MGFFSSLGSVCRSVCNAVSSVCGAVSSAFKSTVNCMGSVLSTAKTLMPELTVSMPFIGKISPIITGILHCFGLLFKDENIEQIGDRVLQAEDSEIRPSDFKTYNEYMKAIREIRLDPKKSEQFNIGEKIAAGILVSAWGMDEHFGEGSSDLLSCVLRDAPKLSEGKGYFTGTRIQNIVDKIKDVSDVAKYFNNQLNKSDMIRIENDLVSAEQTLNPDKTKNDIYRELDRNRNN